MFEIDKLLVLFDDERTKAVISNSYLLSQSQNKELSDNVFTQLLYIKYINPSLNIIFDPNLETACYDSGKNTIYLKSISISTFFHELTHLLSYYFSQYQIPREYYEFKNKFLLSDDKRNLVISLLNSCKEKKQRLLSESDIKQNDNFENNINKLYSGTSFFQNIEYDTIIMIEDIIDSIYDGQSFTQGLAYIKDNEHNPVKSQKSAGHGCEYYSQSMYQFEELLADYQTIKLTDPNNPLFILLQEIIGNEFVLFLEQRCQKINGEVLIDKDLDISHLKK